MASRVHRLLLGVYRRLPVRARRRAVGLLTPSFTVGAMCILERSDGAVLLVRLSYRRRWGVPGGLLERGESPADACRREAKEEVGMDIELVGEPAVVVDPDARRVDVVYRARLARGQEVTAVRTASPEVVEARWFAADELPELQAETSTAIVALARAVRIPHTGPRPGDVLQVAPDGLTARARRRDDDVAPSTGAEAW